MSTISKPVHREPTLVYKPAVKSEALGRRNRRKTVISKLQPRLAKRRSGGFKTVDPDVLEADIGQSGESGIETVGG